MSQEEKKNEMSSGKAYAIAGGTTVGAILLIGSGAIFPVAIIGGVITAVWVASDYNTNKLKVGNILSTLKTAYGISLKALTGQAKKLDAELSKAAEAPKSESAPTTLTGASSGSDFNAAGAKAEPSAPVATPAVKNDLKP